MTRTRIIAALGAVSLTLSGCCFGGGGKKESEGPKPEVVKKSDMKMADPGALKSVQKVAIASITSTCNITDDSVQGKSGGNKSVFGMINSAKTMNNLDATRSPASLEVGIPQFLEEFQKGTGWTFVPIAEVKANPAYEQNTFPVDLKEQVKMTRTAWCTAGEYRVLTDAHTPRAGEIAKALGVDAVALVHFDFFVDNWDDPRMTPDPKGSAQFHVRTDARLTLVNPAGEVLYTETLRNIANTDDVKFIGFNEKAPAVSVVTGVEWSKVPKNAGNTMKNAGIQMSAAVKKAQTGT